MTLYNSCIDYCSSNTSRRNPASKPLPGVTAANISYLSLYYVVLTIHYIIHIKETRTIIETLSKNTDSVGQYMSASQGIRLNTINRIRQTCVPRCLEIRVTLRLYKITLRALVS